MSIECVYILYYYQGYQDEEGSCNDVWQLGVFASLRDAEDAIRNHYLKQVGFKDKRDKFFIEEVVLNETEWKEGFDELIDISDNSSYIHNRPNTSGRVDYSYTVYRRA